MSDELSSRYYLELACAFVRGRLPDAPALPPAELFCHGEESGLRLHKFKRSAVLPRVKRVFGFFHQLRPSTLLDVGSGRGVFLWPLLDSFADLGVHCIDVRQDRVTDLLAVREGGVGRLNATVMDATAMTFPDDSFDAVTLLEVLEHLQRPAEAVAHSVRVARRFVVASVPSKPDDNPEHIHLFTGDTLSELFHEAGVARVSVSHVLNHVVALAVLEPA
jgi:ubiquinone/menaquinone biosynthesis C-methylase UbiE